MNENAKTNYFKIFKEDYKAASKLVHKSIGVLLVYYLICSLFTQYVIFRICSMLWTLALKTVPGCYLSDTNWKDAFTHPLVILVGLVEVIIFCIVCIWQNAGLLMILESNRQEKPVKLFTILYKSFEQIKHVTDPKNWKIYLLVVIILPLTDNQMSSSALSEITIPEFISDFILSKVYLSILVLAAGVALVIFYFKYILVQQSFVLEQKSFKEAAKTSGAAKKPNRIYAGISQVIVSAIGTLAYLWLPIILMGICEAIVINVMKDYAYGIQIATWTMEKMGVKVLTFIGSGYIKMYVMAFSVTVFHSICERENVDIDIKLVDGIEKTKGKIRPLKGWIRASYALIFVVVIGVSSLLIFASNHDSTLLAGFINDTKIAAHKGYSSKAPENTMAAFELACNDEAVDMIELDVRETKDGVPVVIHNESIYDATGVEASVYDMNLDELQALNACYGFEEEYPDAYIPTLDEVLATYAGKKDFLIEIKNSDRTPDLPVKIAQLMEKYGITETSMIHSGSYDAISKVKEYNPDIKCGFIMALSTGGYYDLENADFFSLEHSFVTDTALENAHLRGKKIFAWTVNEEQSMEDMRNVEVDMVITDYPDECDDIILGTSNSFEDAIASSNNSLGLAKYLNPSNWNTDNEIDRESY